MGIGSVLSNIFSGGAKDIVDSVGNAIDKLSTSKEEKEALKIELLKEVNRNIEALQASTVRETELQLADVASARDREIQINQTDKGSWLSKNVGSIIALAVFIFMIVLYILALIGTLKSGDNITFLVISSITNIAVMVASYYFGSTKGASDRQTNQDKLLKSMTDKV